MISINALNQSKWVYDTLEPLITEEKSRVQPDTESLYFKDSLEVENTDEFSFLTNGILWVSTNSISVPSGGG